MVSGYKYIKGYIKMKKRHDLPAFKKLDMTIDVERIIEEVRNMPAQANTDDLKEKDGYGELVGGKCGCLQKAFGLKFDTIEEAYEFLQDNDVEEADLKGSLPAGRRMAWDFRNYVKQYHDFIEEGDDGKFQVNQTPYKQIAFTQYNPDEEDRIYEKKMDRHIIRAFNNNMKACRHEDLLKKSDEEYYDFAKKMNTKYS